MGRAALGRGADGHPPQPRLNKVLPAPTKMTRYAKLVHYLTQAGNSTMKIISLISLPAAADDRAQVRYVTDFRTVAFAQNQAEPHAVGCY